MDTKILIIGACGQIGSELTLALRNSYGSDHVIASDIREANPELKDSGIFEQLDVMNEQQLRACIEKHNITEVYLMAAMLSATGEKFPMKAWDLNMRSLLSVLEIAKEQKIAKIFWPSSIAVFGPTTPKQHTPQQTIMEPSTVYGISKLAGENWCSYYFSKYGVDVRSIRYPGIISWKTAPGGGTTDYAVDIYHKATTEQKFECFLSEHTALPMIYMEDAIAATIGIMRAPSDTVKIRTSYNIGGISVTPEAITKSIQKHIPEFTTSYKTDFRQAIADSWPDSIDDRVAQQDWGWSCSYSLEQITKDMLDNLKPA